MTEICFIASLLASVAGAICGIGGGVIIKPVLDALGIMSVSSISFLSGCTVLAMTTVSVGRRFSGKTISRNYRLIGLLAFGSASGGVIGKQLFQMLKETVGHENIVGIVQAAVFAVITAGTLLYTIFKQKIKTRSYDQVWICLVCGILLGILSSFFGIGGGPINLVALMWLFSMGTKEAAICSQCIILVSQAASLGQTLITGNVPEFQASYLIMMIVGGMSGGLIGSQFNKKISPKQVDHLFEGLMVVIILINIYNIFHFMELI